MDDYEIDDILAEETFSPMDYLRSGYQSIAFLVADVGYFIQNYGWHILFGGLVFYYIFKKFIRPALEYFYGTYESYRKDQEDREYAAKYHKTTLKNKNQDRVAFHMGDERDRDSSSSSIKSFVDPDLFSARISAQQEAAQKLQEQYDQQAKDYQEKLKEKEERKRQEVLDLLDKSDKGHRLGNGRNEDRKPKSLRGEYNPLDGPGPSSNYRPPKKSKCGGGGCGR